jgi:O-antigen/teichoic acid export membrane protein
VPKRLIDRGAALSRSPFARSVGSLMALTAVGQGLYIAAAPILGRLYGPEAFGLYGLFYLFITTTAMFICLNYDVAVPAAVDEADANDLAESAIRISVVVCAVIAALLTAVIALDLMGFGDLPWWAGPVAFAVLLLQALIQIFQAWYVRRQTAVTIGQAGITLNAVRSGTQVGIGFVAGAWWGLGLGEVIGRVAALVHSVRAKGAWRPRRGFLTAPVPWAALRRYRQFPLVLLSSTAIEAVVLFAQIATLSSLYGPAGMGQYFMMRRTLDLPIAFAFRSLSDIFYGRLAAHCREAPERVKPFYIRSVIALAAIGFVGALPLMIWGEPMFELVLGSAWGEAGLLAAVMAPSAVMNLAVAPASRIFGLSSRAWLRYFYTAANALSTALVLVLAWTRDWSLFTTTCGLSAAISFGYLVYFLAGVAAADRLITVERPVGDVDDPALAPTTERPIP